MEDNHSLVMKTKKFKTSNRDIKTKSQTNSSLKKLEKCILLIKGDSIFLVILLIGLFLRIFRIEQNFPFDGEVGDNLLDIKNAFIHHQIPVLGPPTSHPWLNFGPLFYWLYGPILWLSKFNPISHQYFAVAIALLTITANYYVIKNIFSKQVAIISSIFISISPMLLFTTRLGRFTFIVPLLVYPFFWILTKLVIGEKKYLFLLFFLLGLMLNFHYTPLFLIPVIIILLFIKKIRVNFKDIILSLGGLLVPLIPLLMYDSQHKFSMILNLALWIPYRILGFLGIYHKNTLTQQVLQENKLSVINFFSFSFTPTPYDSYTIAGLIIFFLILLYVFYQLYSGYKNKKLVNSWLILFVWMSVGFIALFIHGNVPLHYFVPLFPIPFILFSLLLTDLLKHRLGKVFTIGIIIFFVITNFYYYFWSNWYYQPEKSSAYVDGLISYNSRKAVAQFIVNNALHNRYQLRRIGYNDFFAKQFAQNYLYLLWWYGNEPVNKAKLTYTIVENGSQLSHIKRPTDEEFVVKNVIVLKSTR